MSARVIREGLTVFRLNTEGELTEVNLTAVLAESPKHSEWMFAIVPEGFCWVKGLPEGQGYQMYILPMSANPGDWRQQVEQYRDAGPDSKAELTTVPVETKTMTLEEGLYIISA